MIGRTLGHYRIVDRLGSGGMGVVWLAEDLRLRRRVATDAFVDVDTVRYSVPHRLVRDQVDVVLDEQTVRIFHGPTVVATHTRSSEPFARVVDPTHYDGLWRRPALDPEQAAAPTLASLGRDLAEYAAIVAGGAR